MFWRKRENEDLRSRSVRLDDKLIIEKGAYTPKSSPLGPAPTPSALTSPIAELCADIKAHPGDYERCDGKIVSERDSRLWIHPSSWTSCFSDTGKVSSRRIGHSEQETGMMLEAARALDDYLARKQDNECAARLAKVKAERSREGTKRRKPGEPITQDWLDYIGALDGEIDAPATRQTESAIKYLQTALAKIHPDNPSAAIAIQTAINTLQTESQRTVTAFLCANAWAHDLGHAPETLFPTVYALKQADPCAAKCGIVEVEVRLKRRIETITIDTCTPGDDRPVGPTKIDWGDDPPPTGHKTWPDKNGIQHRTRAAMRAANVEISFRQKATAPPRPLPDPPMRKGG